MIFRVRRYRMVRAHLTGMDESVEGVLHGRTRDFYVLRGARVISETGESVTLAGMAETLIPRDRVLFFQTI